MRSRPEDLKFMETSDSSKGMGQKPNVSSDGEHQNSWGPPKMVIGIGSLAFFGNMFNLFHLILAQIKHWKPTIFPTFPNSKGTALQAPTALPP